jgi:hypothetical protein
MFSEAAVTEAAECTEIRTGVALRISKSSSEFQPSGEYFWGLAKGIGKATIIVISVLSATSVNAIGSTKSAYA